MALDGAGGEVEGRQTTSREGSSYNDWNRIELIICGLIIDATLNVGLSAVDPYDVQITMK